MIGLTAEQQQLAKIIHDYACRFPPTEDGDAQLLQGCYDYMEAFKQVLDSSSKIQIDYIFLKYPGFFTLCNMDGVTGAGNCRWSYRCSERSLKTIDRKYLRRKCCEILSI